MTTFKQFLADTYSVDVLKEISEHGCASYAPGEMIYYSETCALYDLHCEELHEVIGYWTDEIGFLPNYILEHIGDAKSFKNAIVWVVAEYYANEMIAAVNELEPV